MNRVSPAAALAFKAGARVISPLTAVPGVVWFLVKVGFLFFLIAMAKAMVPRYRYDQLMRIGWKVFLPLSIAAVVIVAAVLRLTGLAPG